MGITFRLEVKAPSSDAGTYIGMIKSLKDCGRIRDVCDSLTQVFDVLEAKTVRLQLQQKTLILFECLGTKKKVCDMTIHMKKEGASIETTPELIQIRYLNSQNLPLNCSVNWISKDCFYYNRLKLQQNRIAALDNSFVFGACAVFGRFKFKIKINTIPSMIQIGLNSTSFIPRKCVKNQYFYYLSNGLLYEGGTIKNQLAKFKINDEITMIGNLSKCTVKFEQNGIKIGVIKCYKMKNIKKQLVPYVYLDQGSAVSIVDSFPDIGLLAVGLAESLFKWDYDVIYQMNNLIELMEADESENEQSSIEVVEIDD